MNDDLTCECGSPLASGGVVGMYCTNRNCPVEKALVREVASAFKQRQAAAPSPPAARSKSQLRRLDALGANQFTCEFCGAVRAIAPMLDPKTQTPLTGVDFLQAWMRAPNPMLGDVVPLDMLKTGRGQRLALFIEEAYLNSSPPETDLRGHHRED